MPEVPGAALIQNPSGAFQGTDTAGTEIDQDTLVPQGVIPGVKVTGTPSAGEVLTATSPTAADWQAPPGGVGQGQITGTFWSTNWFGSGVGVPSLANTGYQGGLSGLCTLMPVIFSQPVSFTAIGIYVITAGSSGSVIRLGVYKHDPVQGVPGDLILDAGTVPALTNNNFESTPISLTLQPGLYWLASAFQGSSGALPVVDGVGALTTQPVVAPPGLAEATTINPDLSAGGVMVPAVIGATGPLPANIVSVLSDEAPNQGPRVWLQQA